MLKKDTKPEEVKIYELYIQRMVKECDLIWSRFKIYFGFESGILLVVGFIFRPYLGTPCFNIPTHLLSLIKVLCFVGMIFSFIWFLIQMDGRRWQLCIDKVIAKVEDSIFDDEDLALYKAIFKAYKEYKLWKLQIDVVSVSLFVPWLFFISWLSLLFFAIK